MVVPHHVLVELGARWSSALVLAEAEVALHRWSADAEALRPYGWGPSRRERFEGLVDRLRQRHDAWSGRPAPQRDVMDATRDARRWFDRALSILEAASLEHEDVSEALADIPQPGTGVGTLRESLRVALQRCLACRPRLDTDAADASFFELGTAALSALDAVDGPNPRDPSVRAEVLDALDGEVFLTVRGLNRAAWRAFHEASPERAGRYVMQFLVTFGRGAQEPASEPPPSAE